MANIQPEINDFKNAVYGEDVRDSMVSLAEKLNTEVEAGTTNIAQHNTDITNAIAQSNSASAAASTAATNANNAATAANTARTNIQANENQRQANEQVRLNFEAARQNAEQNRADAETARVNAENARVTAENQRQANEQARQSAENTRANAESDREAAEAARRTAEAGRVTAEAERVGNEQSRIANENLRQAQERERVNNETERQRAFNNMSQQVLPPATSTTLGGVIIGDGLTVDADGKIDVTGGGDLETKAHAAATYATIESVNGKADSVHVHSADDITSGTLPVARGGTGKATHTSNAVLTGNGTSAVGNIATASGALYATAANSAPQFGTLPIAQGGTNATTAADARDNLEAFWTGGDEIIKESTSPAQSILVTNASERVFRADWNGNLFAGTFNYGACSTGANTPAKVATVGAGFQLIEGATVYLKCANANSFAGALTLNVDGIGANPVWAGGKATAAASGSKPANSVTWSAGAICEFVYSNDAWHYVGNNLDGVYGMDAAEQAIADNAANISLLMNWQLKNDIALENGATGSIYAMRYGGVIYVMFESVIPNGRPVKVATLPPAYRPYGNAQPFLRCQSRGIAETWIDASTGNVNIVTDPSWTTYPHSGFAMYFARDIQ